MVVEFLKGIFDSAVKWRWISFNPCAGAELPSIKRNREKEIWLPNEVAQFFKSDIIVNSKYYVMLLVSFSTGMRPGEICALTWASIAEDHISVTAGMDRKKRATDLKTDGSNRKIYIDKQLYLKFMIQSKWQKENKLLFGNEYQESDYVFTHEDGTAISPYRYSVAFRKLLKQSKLELPQISLYGARHSFASNAIASGVEPSIVASILGHATISTTYDNYVHVQSEPIRKVSELMYNITAQ